MKRWILTAWLALAVSVPVSVSAQITVVPSPSTNGFVGPEITNGFMGLNWLNISQFTTNGSGNIRTGATVTNLNALGTGSKSVAVGTNAAASGASSTAIGDSTVADEDQGTAIGYQANTSAVGQIRLGNSTSHVQIGGVGVINTGGYLKTKLLVETLATGNSAATNTFGIGFNTGASALVTMNLPAASVGQTYTFYVTDADGIRITPNTSAAGTIRISAAVSSAGNAGGYIQSTTIGSSVTLTTDGGDWYATSIVGTWTSN